MANTNEKGTFAYDKSLPKNAPKAQTGLLSSLPDGTYSFEVKEVRLTAKKDRDGAYLGLQETKQNVWVGVDVMRYHGGDEIKPTGSFKCTGGIMSDFSYAG